MNSPLVFGELEDKPNTPCIIPGRHAATPAKLCPTWGGVMTYDNHAIFKAIRERPDLTATEKCVAYTIASYRNSETGLCCPSQLKIALKCGLSRPYVNEIVGSLKRKRVLEARKGRFSDFSRKTVLNYTFLFDKAPYSRA